MSKDLCTCYLFSLDPPCLSSLPFQLLALMSSPPRTLPDTCLYLKVLAYSPMAAWLTESYNCPSPFMSPITGIHEASWKQNFCLTSHCNPEYKSTFLSSVLLDKNSVILPSFARDFDSISKHIGVPLYLGFGNIFLLMPFDDFFNFS